MITQNLIALTALVAVGGIALAQGNSGNAPGQDRVCLVTFKEAGTTANTAVTGAKILPRKAAEAQASDTKQIFEYGAQGELTVEACACLDDANTRADCKQPVKPPA